MKKLLLFTLFLATSLAGVAQNKMLTIEDAILKRFSTLAPESLTQLAWLPGSLEYIYVDDQPAEVLKKGKAGSSASVWCKLTDLNKAMKPFTEKDSTFNSFPYMMWENNRSFQFSYSNAYYSFDLKKKKVEKILTVPDGVEDANYVMEHSALTYKMGKDLFILKAGENHKPIAINDKVNLGMVASRNEMGITKGTFWSNSSKYLAFFAVDESLVTDYPIYNLNDKPASDDKIKYPFAGTESQVVYLGVYNLETKKTTYLSVKKDSFDYLTNIAWGPKDEFIYLAMVNRGQNHIWFQKYNAETGELETDLFEEKNDRYVEPEHDMIFNPVNADQFLWFSERDGYNHLYLYDVNGELIKQVTKGNWIVTNFHGFDKKGENIYISTTKDGALNRTVYSVNIATGNMTKLTSEEGTHSVSFNDDCTDFIDWFQSLSVPKVITIRNTERGDVKNNLLTSKDPLADYKLGTTEFVTLKADDGTELYGRIIKPIDFDPNKKYPCITYVYGGPHVQLVRNLWLGGADLWMNYMAQKGYVVFTLDSRGSDNRGHKFESATHRQLGTVEIRDQQVGANYLKSLSYVNADKMAIFGWSFGGFMTTSLMTRTPGTYKVGVAGGPVIDWSYYEIMYTERYMDSPQENPEGYENASLFNYVKDLQDRLLIIHGTSDDVVLWQHSLLYVKKAVEEGVLLDYFVYPHHPHNVRGKDRVHLYMKITDYIERNL